MSLVNVALLLVGAAAVGYLVYSIIGRGKAASAYQRAKEGDTFLSAKAKSFFDVWDRHYRLATGKEPSGHRSVGNTVLVVWSSVFVAATLFRGLVAGVIISVGLLAAYWLYLSQRIRSRHITLDGPETADFIQDILTQYSVNRDGGIRSAFLRVVQNSTSEAQMREFGPIAAEIANGLDFDVAMRRVAANTESDHVKVLAAQLSVTATMGAYPSGLPQIVDAIGESDRHMRIIKAKMLLINVCKWATLILPLAALGFFALSTPDALNTPIGALISVITAGCGIGVFALLTYINRRIVAA